MDAATLQTARDYHRWREQRRWKEREALRREKLQAARAVIRRLAPAEPAIGTVHLFGSIVRAGGFTASSDIDVAVDCDDLEAEGRFWRDLEEALEWNVDLRAREGGIARAVKESGERVYEREAARSRAQHPE